MIRGKIVTAAIVMAITYMQNRALEIQGISMQSENFASLQDLWRKNHLSGDEIPSYWYFTNAGYGHYHITLENQVAFAVKEYAGMTGMEEEAWSLKRICYTDGIYHAYVESETGNELYIFLSDDETEVHAPYIIAADIRANGSGEILLQNEAYSYNSMLEWHSYKSWFDGDKEAAWENLEFLCESYMFDYSYETGWHYAVYDYLDRTGGNQDCEWIVDDNVMYVGRNGYIADISCTNGEKEFIFLVDVWNRRYAVVD